MGAKTAILAFADGDLREALRGAVPCSPKDAEALVRRVHPGYTVESIHDGTLEYTYPMDDVTYATVLAGGEVVCDKRLVMDNPSELPPHLLELGAGRRIIMHGMHSVVDWLCFAVWEDGRLVRSLSLSPGDGIIENIGEPYEFERPFWAGEHPVLPWPGEEDDEDDGPYPFVFHPLELGEEALRALFGFTIEGEVRDDAVDIASVHMHGFSVTDPTGVEQAEREAFYQQFSQSMEPPRFYEVGPDGSMREVALEDL